MKFYLSLAAILLCSVSLTGCVTETDTHFYRVDHYHANRHHHDRGYIIHGVRPRPVDRDYIIDMHPRPRPVPRPMPDRGYIIDSGVAPQPAPVPDKGYIIDSGTVPTPMPKPSPSPSPDYDIDSGESHPTPAPAPKPEPSDYSVDTGEKSNTQSSSEQNHNAYGMTSVQ